MNIERLQQVRAAMAAAPETLTDMAQYGEPSCGTPGCIAGWTLTVAKQPITFVASKDAREWLGLTPCQGSELFLDDIHVPDIAAEGITKVEVLHALDTMIETGTPVWPQRVQVLEGF